MRTSGLSPTIFGEGQGVYALSLHAAVRAGSSTLQKFFNPANKAFYRVRPKDDIDLLSQRVNRLDDKGFSALHYALQLLVQDLQLKNYSKARDARDMIIMLIAHGASHSVGVHTPLMYAVNHGLTRKDILNLYIVFGDINKRESETGRTALHYAAARGNRELTKLLIIHGAHCNLESLEKDRSGVKRMMTAYEIALDRGYDEVASCFELVQGYEASYAAAITQYEELKEAKPEQYQRRCEEIKSFFAHRLKIELGSTRSPSPDQAVEPSPLSIRPSPAPESSSEEESENLGDKPSVFTLAPFHS